MKRSALRMIPKRFVGGYFSPDHGRNRNRLHNFVCDKALDPDRIIDSIQILFAKIRRDRDYRFTGLELRRDGLHSGQNCPGAPADQQVMIADERETTRDGPFFVDGNDPVGLCEVCEFWSDAGTDTGDVPFTGSTSERNGTERLDGDDFYPREFLTKSLLNTPERAGCSRADENPM